jgi:hypothetical protein
MVFSVSPSVTVKEVDLTTVIPAIGTPPGVIVGAFGWGPVNERVLVTSENELASIFGKPKSTNFETWFTAADFLAYSNALYVTRVVSDAAETAGVAPFEAKYPGELGNSILVSVASSANSFSQELASEGELTGTVALGENTLSFTSQVDFTDKIKAGDVIRVGNSDVGYQDLKVSSIIENIDANTLVSSYEIETVNRFALAEANLVEVSLERRWGYSNIFDRAPDSGKIHIAVIDSDGSIAGVAGAVLETFSNLSLTAGDKLSDGSNNFYIDVLTNSSSWISYTGSPITETDAPTYLQFTGGLDGATESSIPFGKVALGYDLYKESEEIDISFILQGKAVGSSNIANYIISNILEYRRDCILFVSPRSEDVVNVASPQTQTANVIAFRNSIQNSSYWFMDSGYKYRYDKYNDTYRWVPLNGDMAGITSRTESWESPAGYTRGFIRNVVKLAFNPNKALRDQLYGRDVNPVITQVGQGTLLFGDKTGLGQASAFNRINVRRLFLTVQKAVATVSAKFLFNFNDSFTQTQFKNLVEPFLRDIQGKRGIIDFRVVSDGTVNTPDVVDRNIFRGNIFIKPSRTINFIELTFIATRTGVEFEEIVGQQF